MIPKLFSAAGFPGGAILGANVAITIGALDKIYRIGQLAVVIASLVATYWLIRKTKAQALIAERKEHEADLTTNPLGTYRPKP